MHGTYCTAFQLGTLLRYNYQHRHPQRSAALGSIHSHLVVYGGFEKQSIVCWFAGIVSLQ